MRSNLASAAVLVGVLSSGTSAAAGPWSPIGPQGGPVDALALDPTNPQVLYAGAYGGGVWKSSDGGTSWTRLSGVPPQQSVEAIAVDPKSGKTILAGTYDAGIWRSTDGGATWKQVHKKKRDGERLADVQTIVFDPKSPSVVYAGTDSEGEVSGVLKSTDGGATWKESDEGLVKPYYARVFALAVHPETSSTLYAGTSEGLWRSTDSAATWSHVESGIGDDQVNSLAIDASGTVLAGAIGDIWRSSDGASWAKAKSAVHIAGDTVSEIVADPTRPGTFFAGLPNYVLRSTDRGMTWSSIDDRFEWITFRSLAVDPSGALFTGTSHRGVLKTTDGGKTWTELSGGYTALEIWSIAVDPSSPKTLYASSSQAGVSKSIDGGATWTIASEGLTSRTVFSLAIDPSNPASLLAGTRKGIHRSTDGARTWKPVATSAMSMEVRTVRFVPDSKRAYGRDEDTIWKSDDAGANWTEMKPSLKVDSTTRGRFALAADPASPDTVLANTDRTFFRSTDSGKTWGTASGIPATTRIQVAVADAASKTLYAGTVEGVYRSTDSGATWTLSGKTGTFDVQTLLVDPSTPGTVYAGTWRQGVIRTKDGGTTWTRIGGDAPHPDATSLALEPGTSNLLVGFGGAGVWRLDLAAADKAPAPPATKKK
jgi:photosystem II stability/assembly factor-like uncharacterized protein